MNYRHHFHAGNFADVMKHALWLTLLQKLTATADRIQVIDTHAGAGIYDLQGPLAQRSSEADGGVIRLMDDGDAPAEFQGLKTAVAAENASPRPRFYPGSPLLTVQSLRPADHYLGCEWRAEDQAALQALLKGRHRPDRASAQTVLADGYERLAKGPLPGGGRLACLIDPPFERGDEYDRIVSSVAQALSTAADAVFAIWAPLKDLETLDALLRRLEALRPPTLMVAEVRLRPLLDPMKMNGSALTVIGGPDLEAEANAVCAWTAARCGEAGSLAKVRKLGR